MNSNNVIALRVNDKARSFARRIAAGVTAVGAAVASGAAFAQASDLGSAVKTEITNGKTSVTEILLVLAGVLGLFLLWGMVKKAR